MFEIANVAGYRDRRHGAGGRLLGRAQPGAVAARARHRTEQQRVVHVEHAAAEVPGREGGQRADDDARDDRRPDVALRDRRDHAGARVEAEDRHEHVEPEILEQLPGGLGIRAAERRLPRPHDRQCDPDQEEPDRRSEPQLDPTERDRDRADERTERDAQGERHDIRVETRPDDRADRLLEDLDPQRAAGHPQYIALLDHRLGPRRHLFACTEHRVHVDAVPHVRGELAELAPDDRRLRDDDIDGLRAHIARDRRVDLAADPRAGRDQELDLAVERDRVAELEDEIVARREHLATADHALDRDPRLHGANLRERVPDHGRLFDLVGADGDRQRPSEERVGRAREGRGASPCDRGLELLREL